MTETKRGRGAGVTGTRLGYVRFVVGSLLLVQSLAPTLGPPLIRAIDPSKRAYRVELPSVVWTDGSQPYAIDFGSVTLKVTIIDATKLDLSLTFPPTLTVRDDRGRKRGEIISQSRLISGIWDSELIGFSDLHINLANLSIVDPKSDAQMDLGGITLRSEISTGSPDLLDTRFGISLEDFLFVTADNDVSVRVRELAGTTAADGIDRNEFIRIQRSVLHDGKTFDPSFFARINPSSQLFDTMRSAFQLGGVTVRTQDTLLTLESLSTDVWVNGFNQPAAEIRLSYTHEGVDFIAPQLIPEFLPYYVSAQIRLDEFPLKKFSQMLADEVEMRELLSDAGDAGDDRVF